MTMKTFKYLFSIIAFFSAISTITAQTQQKTTSKNTGLRFVPAPHWDSDSEIKAKEDSVNKLIPSNVKNDFTKRCPNAKDLKWHIEKDFYYCKFNTSKTNQTVEYFRVGVNAGKWKSTEIWGHNNEEIRALIDSKLLSKIISTFKKENDTITNILILKCSENCVGNGPSGISLDKYSASEGYYVSGTTRNYTCIQYTFNIFGEILNREDIGPGN